MLFMHEHWQFNDRAAIQKLVRFMILCEMCHDAATLKDGHISHAINQLYAINKNITPGKAANDVYKAIEKRNERNRSFWSTPQQRN